MYYEYDNIMSLAKKHNLKKIIISDVKPPASAVGI